MNLKEHYEKHRNDNLPRLWQMHQDVIRRVLYRYPFVNMQDHEDYTQEIFLYIWERYDKWLDAQTIGISFAQWLYVKAKTCIVDCRCRQLGIGRRNPERRYRERMIYYEDMGSFIVSEMEKPSNYSEENFRGLERAISELRAPEKKVISMFMDGECMTAKSVEHGKCPSRYNTVMSLIVKKIRANAAVYFVDYTIKEKVRKEGVKGNDNVLSKAVFQLKMDGEVVRLWENALAAEREEGFKSSSIRQVARGEKFSYRGFRWAYECDGILKVLSRTRGAGNVRSILQLSPSGELIKRWETVTAAVTAGYSETCIRRVISGERPHYKGYKWQYAS
ncbi:sigma factor [Chitinophaga cymbidii]|nr:sigma factor [Chitinophaga cymbidii]